MLGLLLSVALAQDPCKSAANEFKCVSYVKNYDGDTVKFNIPKVHWLLGKNISIRVLGVDAPEMHGKRRCEHKAAVKAQARIQGLLKGAKQIDLQKIARDKYFRILADVIYDGQSLTDVLLKEKIAYPYMGETKQKVNWCTYGKL
jgi:micrococcal nuclease